MKRCYAILLIALAVVSTSCSWMPGPMDVKCDEHRVREYPAPDGKLKAVEIHSVCEDGQYVVSVELSGGPADRATAMHANWRGPQPPTWPNMAYEWKSNNELWVTYPGGVDVTCIANPPGAAVHCMDGTVGAKLALKSK
jgi:hypothetical protein